MAHFYGEVQGGGGTGSRTGTKKSGFWSHVRGWKLGVEVTMREVDGEDVAEINLTGGSDSPHKRTPLGHFRLRDLVARLKERRSLELDRGVMKGMDGEAREFRAYFERAMYDHVRSMKMAKTTDLMIRPPSEADKITPKSIKIETFETYQIDAIMRAFSLAYEDSGRLAHGIRGREETAVETVRLYGKSAGKSDALTRSMIDEAMRSLEPIKSAIMRASLGEKRSDSESEFKGVLDAEEKRRRVESTKTTRRKEPKKPRDSLSKRWRRDGK